MSGVVTAGSKATGAGYDWTGKVRIGTLRASTIGYASIALFVAVFGVWAVTAPLAGAAIAGGVVAAAGRNLIVQHFEGGIISSIHVAEGDTVKAGDVLMTLDSTRARATVNTLLKQSVGLRARAARLTARRDGADSVTFDPKLVALAEQIGMSQALDEQRAEFEARLARFRSEIVILEQRVSSARESIAGLESQNDALRDQLAVVEEEASRKKELLDRGLTNRSEYTLLLRAQADLVGQRGSIISQIEQAKSRIAEAREQIIRQETARVEEALGELNEINVKLGDVEEQIAAARYVLERTEIRSPADGRIIRMPHTTLGSVVQSGAEVAEVLPISSELIVQAELRTVDINLVRVGQNARLRFLALNARRTPEVPATVIFVSPDRVVDSATQQQFYIARLKIADELPPDVDRSQIMPGMPVEVMITGEERTFVEYLVQPITDSFARAFREE